MNKVYQRIWSKVKERWILVSEKVAGGVCPSGIVGAITLAAFLSLSGPVSALDPGALPTGGKITSGKGSISSVGSQMTVNQNTQKMIANWNTFNIGTKAGVTFRQPNSDATALNRIYDQNPSQILGSLSANGNIFLINPSGIVFGQGAQINVGGLVASSLNMLDSDFLAGKYTFLNDGKAGSIINQGNISVIPGGIVALIAPKVTNEGTINAQSGDVLMAAGDKISLDFNGDGLINYTIDKGAVDALAENKGLIKADGGVVVMTAKAADSLTSAVVNNSGVIEAQTLENKGGRIILMSDMANGQTNVGGKLDASAPNGGDGGFIETSGKNVKINDGVEVTTYAPNGSYGLWLIDPQDFNVGGADSDMSGTTLSTNLEATPVELQSSNGGTTGEGNVNINEDVSWSSDTTLTLTASNDVNINADITATGDAAGLVISPNTANGTESASGNGVYSLNNGAVITLSGATPGLTIAGNAYTIINEANGGITTLQGMGTSGYYALGSNIEAAATSSWNPYGTYPETYAGFVPVGNNGTPFTGMFDGLGHTINNLYINRPTQDFVGLFGFAQSSTISNVGLIGGSVSGRDHVGELVGYKEGGMVTNAYATGSVTGNDNVGGLVGSNYYWWVTNVYATGSVTGNDNIGGLVGNNEGGMVTNAYATGSVSGGTYVGGLVGWNYGSITNAYTTGSVTGTSKVGGLVGWHWDGSISDTYATGHVNGTSNIGGLVGVNMGGVGSSFWDTVTTGTSTGIGGGDTSGATGLTTTEMMDSANFSGWDFTNDWFLISGNTRPFLRSEYSINIVNAHQLQLMTLDLGASYTLGANIDLTELSNPSGMWDTTKGFVPVGDNSTQFTGQFDGLGHAISYLTINRPTENFVGLFGYTGSGSAISNVGLVGGSVSGSYLVGGLVGRNSGGAVSNAYVTGSVTGSNNDIGGLVGMNEGGSISNSYSTGDVSGSATVGGLVGWNNGSITNSYNTGDVSGLAAIGGLVGINEGGSISNSYSTGDVSGTDTIGGLVGRHDGSISESYASGSVNGSGNVGGLVGKNIGSITNAYAIGNVSGSNYTGGLVGTSYTGSTIETSFATGNVTGSSGYTGGLVGYNYGTVSSSYWDTETTGQALAIGVDNGTTDATGLTTAQMMDSTQMSGLDFVNDWWLSEGNTRPFLRMEYSTNIINAHQLQLMAMDPSAIYTLDANIDMAELSNPSGMWDTTKGFVPVGDYGTPFTGTLDGQGHTISYLTINRSNDDYVGLFGATGTGSAISNVGLVGGSVNGFNYVGGLVGGNTGSITNSYFTGAVSGSNNNNIGGLVGRNNGSIETSYATGYVIGSEDVGGLVGRNNGSITNSYATGDVSGDYQVGSLVGNGTGSISNSYATGDVSGIAKVGGLVGYSTGSISNSYATGDVSGSNYGGGLVGRNYYGTISKTYATGSVSGSSYTGGLVGWNNDSITNSYATGTVTGIYATGGLVGYNYGTVSSSYWDTITSGTSTGIGGGTLTGATGLTTAQMMDSTQMSGLDFVNTWWLSEGNTRPFLRMEHSTNIVNAHQLQLMAMDPDSSYTLGADIDMSELSNPSGMWDTTKGFVPVGDDFYSDQFTGRLDGQGHTISNLTINRPTENYVGLFGYTGYGSAISNVGLVGGSVSGRNGVGSLVGFNNGSISNTYATGSVIGGTYSDNVGGLVGGNDGTIADSYATGDVSGSGIVGGLVGESYRGSISNSYATGNINKTGYVYGSNAIGGLVGKNSYSNISNSYATGNVNGGMYSGNTGGLVGENTNSSITGSYATGNITGGGNTGGLIGDNCGSDISNAYATGNITGGTYGATGGLIGRNNSSNISESYASGSVSGDYVVGGLVGSNSVTSGAYGIYGSSISNSFATGNVSGSENVGGLVGWSYGSNISNSYATGAISGTYDVGGLVGWHRDGSISDTYATGSVSGTYDVGGLVGFNYSGTISSSYATGDVIGGTYGATGGLVGNNYSGTISSSYATGDVIIGGTYGDAGGLVGNNSGSISSSYATGDVIGGTYGDTGGLVGSNYGSITNSYAMGDVSGSENVGGLVGWNIGSITNSYNTGNVSGSSYVGGLAGYNDGTISNSYATGDVIGGTYGATGGLVGANYGTISSSYWDTETTGQASAVGFNYGSGTVDATGLTTAQMMQSANMPGLDFENDWWLSEGNTRPFLRMEYSTNITNSHQLQMMAMDLSASYTLGANIDMTELSNPSGMWDTTKGFVPVGDNSTQFTGTFDGQGHAISYLTINRPTENYVGLFGYTGSGSAISNVGLVGGSVSGNDYAGGLVARHNGSITNSYNTGDVSGVNHTGGLVGQNSYGSTIETSYATGAVIGSEDVGGLVGWNNGSITNSYATGDVSGDYQVGGLVGQNWLNGTISNSYATGDVSGSTDVGGLVGHNSGTISSSYWDTETTGQALAIGVDNGTTDATGLTTAEMMNSANMPGLDFVNTWWLSEGNTRPFLRSEHSTNIVNAHQLQLMALDPDSSYTLGANIDMTELSNPSGMWDMTKGFVPVGNHGTHFTGTLDGQGHTISNLIINRPTEDYVGLFGFTGSGSAISNVGLDGGSVNGKDYVGGLVGWNDSSISKTYATGTVSGSKYVGGLVGVNYYGTISNAYAFGAVSGTYDVVGGLVGINYYGTISNAYASGNVSGSDDVGGLVGYNNSGGSINKAFATGGVTGTGNDVGGLVGQNNGIISNAAATGVVSGSNYVGGLVGYNSGDISNTFATGTVSGSNYVGGLVGGNYSGSITDSYVTGDVSGSSYVGGLVGWNNSLIERTYATGAVNGSSYAGGLAGANYMGTISSSYWDTETTGQALAVGFDSGTTDATGLTTAEMMQAAYMPDFDFENDWWLSEGNTRPFLRVEYSTNIINTHQLQLMAMDLSADYTLGVDIDMAELSNPSGMWDTTKGFVPIGNDGTQFTGTFNGLGHTINNLTINRPTEDYVGLFGYTVTGSAISNVGLIGGSVNGKNYVGGLVGWNDGDISHAYSTGDVSGIANVGGLVGWSYGSISDSYATGSVSGTSYFNVYLGGLVGYNYGNITNAYATGNVSGSENVGGLVGYNQYGSSISTSYSTGDVSGDYQVGGLVGYNYGSIIYAYATGSVSGENVVGGLVGFNYGSISQTYATGNVSGENFVGGLVGCSEYGSNISLSYWDVTTSGIIGDDLGMTGLTTTEMMQKSSFVGWDIANTGGTNTDWRIYEGHTYPLLSSFLTPLTITADNVSKTYDGTVYEGPLSNVSYSDPGALTSGHLLGTDGYDNARNAGTHTPGFWSDQQGYDISFVNGTLTISPAALTVTAQTNTKTYDGTISATATPDITGTVYGTDTPAFSESYDDKNVGTNKTLTPIGGVNDGNGGNNYTYTFINDTTGVINAAPLSITAKADNKIYDGLAYSHGHGVTIDGFVAGEEDNEEILSGELSYGGNSQGAINAGSYNITPGGLTSGNYTITYYNGTLTISKAPLSITANDDSKTYDALAYSGGNGVIYDGLVNGETSDVLSGTLSYGGNSQGATDVGSYTITPSGLTSGNYEITYDDGTLTINPAFLYIITGNLTGSVVKVYDGTTVATLIPSNYLLSGWQGDDGATVTETTGTYDSPSVGTGKTVMVNLTTGDYSPTGDTNLGNYTLPTTMTGNVGIINPAALSVYANADDKTYNGQAYSGGNGVIYSGFVNDEGSAVLGGSLSYGGNSKGATNAGSYTITPSGLISYNYNITYYNGTLTINPAPLNLITGSLTGSVLKTYDGTTVATLIPSNYLLTGWQGDDGANVTKTTGTYDSPNVGTGKTVTVNLITGDYSATGDTILGNYILPTTVTGNVGIISPAALSVYANADTKTYDGLAYSGGNGVIYSGFVNEENSAVLGGSLAYGGTSQGAINVGSYAITPMGLVSGNYTISYYDGALMIEEEGSPE